MLKVGCCGFPTIMQIILKKFGHRSTKWKVFIERGIIIFEEIYWTHRDIKKNMVALLGRSLRWQMKTVIAAN